jgi:hypothetical protein
MAAAWTSGGGAVAARLRTRVGRAGVMKHGRDRAVTGVGYGRRLLRTTKLIVAGAPALVIALACPCAAPARIAVNRSVGGIGLGMTAREVRARLGAPDLATVDGGSREYVYRDRALVVTLTRSRVAIVATRSRRERTPDGIGPGATTSALRRALPAARCGRKAGVRFCRIGSIRPGQRSTTFQLEGELVVTVTVARGLG